MARTTTPLGKSDTTSCAVHQREDGQLELVFTWSQAFRMGRGAAFCHITEEELGEGGKRALSLIAHRLNEMAVEVEETRASDQVQAFYKP